MSFKHSILLVHQPRYSGFLRDHAF